MFPPFTFSTYSPEIAQAIALTLAEQFPNIRFRVDRFGSSKTYNVFYEARDSNKIDQAVVAQISTYIQVALFAIEKFNSIMDGEDYDYSTQKNFD